MIIHKRKTNDTFEYVEYDEHTAHHIINRTRWKIVYENEDWVYMESDNELLTWILTTMDDNTELYIIPANQVEWSPYDYWYFIY